MGPFYFYWVTCCSFDEGLYLVLLPLVDVVFCSHHRESCSLLKGNRGAVNLGKRRNGKGTGGRGGRGGYSFDVLFEGIIKQKKKSYQSANKWKSKALERLTMRD